MMNYVRTLMKVMPRVCKLLRYEYGSPGVLGYYHAQLIDLVKYPDLRTTVFHAFKEIGNAILFCLLVEQSLVRANAILFCLLVEQSLVRTNTVDKLLHRNTCTSIFS